MKIVGFEKLSLVDYDGFVSATVFTAGCNFACPFCHNGDLVLAGPFQDIENEVVDYLKKRKGILDAVVITGGEPTLMRDLPLFISMVKGLGLRVKLDTNGTNPDMLARLIQDNLVDFVAMDIKNSLSKYALTAGKKCLDTTKIEKSISLLVGSDIDYEFRTTIIEEFHTMDDMSDIAKLIAGAKKYALQKYVDNENCIKNGFSDISIEKAEKMLAVVSPVVKTALLRHYD